MHKDIHDPWKHQRPFVTPLDLKLNGMPLGLSLAEKRHLSLGAAEQFRAGNRKLFWWGAKRALLFMLIAAVIGAFCWTYAINTWLAYAGQPPQIEWWMGALIGFVPYFGRLSIPAAVITWIVTLFKPVAVVTVALLSVFAA